VSNPTNPLLRWEARERGEDRHVRRTGDDYTLAFLSLLPQGQAWPRWIDCTNDKTTLYKVHRGLAYYYGWIDGRAADLLEREANPGFTIELLPDWERAYGLPDPCFPEANTIAERQQRLLMWMRWIGGQSREYFTELLKWLGFEIHIREHAPFMAGISQAGDTRPRARVRYDWVPDTETAVRPIPSGWMSREGDDIPEREPEDNFRWYIGRPEMRFAWSANTGRMGLIWFRASSGQAGVDHHLQFRMPQDLDCMLNRWKPAHTAIVVNTGYLAFGDPMEGTP
jgi:uncharacterized protein YmfQ (DUF2313 family)